MNKSRMWLAADSQSLRCTPLFEAHKNWKAKMVPFCGWNMPVQYVGKGIVQEHRHTRTACGIFDVSHMGQLTIKGKGATKFMEWLTPLALENARFGTTKLSILLNEAAGIIDDIMVTKDAEDTFYMVVNAGRYNEDMKHIFQQRESWLKENPHAAVEITSLYDELSLLALQGPKAVNVVAEQLKHIAELPFMESRTNQPLFSSNVRITRCGYTGEDGFELAIPNNQALELLDTFVKDARCSLIGLGARDTLRLEAGLCLYGHELSENITPIEAMLMWTIPKERRELGGFIGHKKLAELLKKPASKKRVGITLKSGPPAREGATIHDVHGTLVGTVTSGSPSPSLGYNIAQAYIDTGKLKEALKVNVRGSLFDADVTSLPFVKANYYRGNTSSK